MAPSEQGPRLEPPGSGVPRRERVVGRRLLLPAYRLLLAWDRAPNLMERQGRALERLAEGIPPQRLTERVLIPRQTGLEDSSRHHSYAMVLEHLAIVGGTVARIIGELTHGHVPEGSVSTADLKPAEGTPLEAARRAFGAMLVEYRQVVLDPTADRQSPVRYAHPWFGPLGAHAWVCFAPFHQAIHLRQARRICRQLEGV
jgi:hypothetical protein